MGCYRFGNFELDLSAFALRRGGRVLPMQPKVFDVLRYLVEHRTTIVTKAELMRELWHDDNINESVVAWSVSHIRRALGQRRGARSPIETVLGRGYRFTAEVSDVSTVADEPGRAVEDTRPQAALVGRTRIMAELEQHVRAAAQGHGALCVLTGEAGIGKTRCVEELGANAAALGVKALFGRCPQEAGAPPLWPVVAALRGLAQEQPEFAARARAMISGLGDPSDSLQPEQPSGARFRLIEKVASLLRDASAARPLLLILDDVHWADASSLDLLAFIAPELHDLRLCIAVTLRDGELQPGSPRDQPLRRVLRHAQTIPLGAFDAEQVADLAQSIGKHRPSLALAEAVRRAAGGIPLFVEEIVHSLLLQHGERALEQLTPESVRVPTLARDLLRERIHRLPKSTLELLSAASVIGDSFDLSLLLSVVELEPEVLLEQLEPALAEGQLESDAPHAYRFVHSLFQSVFYDDTPTPQRIAIHRKLATLLLARPEYEDRVADVARHFYLSLPAGDPGVVVEHARKAGDVAQRVYEYENAIVYYGWALEAQVFGGAAEPRARGELLLLLATAQRLAGRTRDALETTARLLELTTQHRLHDLAVVATRLRRPSVAMSMVPDDLARSALEHVLDQLPDQASVTRVSALAQLACIPPYASDLARSKDLSARAVTLAGQLPGPEPTFEALGARLLSLSGPDDIDELLGVAARMLAADGEAQPSWHSSDARTARFQAHVLAGRIGEADAVLELMSASIRGQHWPEATFFCERLAAQRCFLDGKFDEADQRWKRVHGQAVRAGVSYADMFYNTHVMTLALEREGARALVARGQMAAAPLVVMTPYARANFARVTAEAGAYDIARSQFSILGDPSSYPKDGHYLNLLANLAACASRVDDKPRCEQLIGLLTPYAELNTPSQMGYYLGSVSYFLGLLADALGRSVDATADFERALERNRAMGYRAGVVRTLLAHGRLATRLDKRSSARELLTGARDEARALGMKGALTDAEAALQAL